MKKVLAIVLALVMVLSFAACGKSKALADDTHEAWVAHGQYLLADGTENSWGGKATEVYEKSALTAISLDDVKKIDQALYDVLSKKDVKYLYTIDLIFGTNDAGWSAKFVKDGKVCKANGSYAFKVAQCTAEVDGSNKVYSEDQWISDPKTAYVEALTPDTVFYPTWQEEADEYGLSWADNPVVTGGAGLYTLVIAQYTNASAPGAPGYGVGLVLKEAKEGIPYVEGFVPADHTFGIVGGFAASDWGNAGADVPMTQASDNSWTGEVTLKAGDEFKVRADGAWNDSWGNGADNLKAEADGTYVVTITFNGGDDVVVEAKLK
ncbi:MAG: hypothetical protein J5528_00130 [Firmicutes bacterium]|nr:hypothetical protein [Bacillota bacterium]